MPAPAVVLSALGYRKLERRRAFSLRSLLHAVVAQMKEGAMKAQG